MRQHATAFAFLLAGFFSVGLILTQSLAEARQSQAQADREAQVREEFNLVDNVVAGMETLDQGEEVWPGYHPAKEPLVLYLPDTQNAYAINLDADEARQWRALSPAHANQTIWVRHRPPYDLEAAAISMHHRIGPNTKAFMMHLRDEWFARREKEKALLYVTHERFHQFQLDSAPEWFAIDTTPGYELVRRLFRAPRVAMMQLENEQMAQYIHTGDMNHLINYLSVANETNNMLFEPERQQIRQMQNVEGIADYVAYRTVERFFPDSTIREQMIEGMQDFQSHENLLLWVTRDRQYAIGASLAYALEQMRYPNWQERIFQSSLLEMVQEMNSVSIEERKGRADALIDTAHYKSLVRDAEERIDNYRDALDEMTLEFERSDRPHFMLDIATNLAFSGINNGTFYRLDEPSYFVKGADGRLVGGAGEFEVIFDKVDLAANDHRRLFYFDGWPYTVIIDGVENTIDKDALWTRKVTTLSWESDTHQATFQLQEKAQLTCEEGSLKIVR